MVVESLWTRLGLAALVAALAALMLSAAGSLAQAAQVVTIEPIGRHVPLLTLEKNENPQNVLIVFTKVDAACRFATSNRGVPVLSDYWLMDRSRYKTVNPLIRKAISKRFELLPAKDPALKFQVRMNDFKELKHDLGANPVIDVSASNEAGKCGATAVIRLGPSDQNRALSVETIEAHSKKRLLPPFRELVSLTFVGKDASTGESFRRTYSAE